MTTKLLGLISPLLKPPLGDCVADILLPPHTKRKTRLSNWFALSVCSSIYKRQFMIEEQLNFNWMLHFEHCRTWIGPWTCSLQYFGSEFGKLYEISSWSHMSTEEEGNCFRLSAILAVKQNWKPFQTGNEIENHSKRDTKLKILPNGKLTVFRDVIKDTNNRHK